MLLLTVCDVEKPSLITKTFETKIRCTPTALWEFHSSADVLKLLTPANRKLKPLSEDLSVREGAIHELQFSFLGIPGKWVAELVEVAPPIRFVDFAKKSPFKYWRHTHEFVATDEEGITLLRDTVTYEIPFGALGALVNRLLISRDIDAMFKHRHKVTKDAMERSAE